MHKTSKIKIKLEELKKQILLSEEEFTAYCNKQEDIYRYPSYINNSILLSEFYKKYKDAFKLRFNGQSFHTINKEKLNLLIKNDYFKKYGSIEIPGELIKKIRDKKTYNLLIAELPEKISNEDVLGSFDNSLDFLKIKKDGLKVRILRSGGLNHIYLYPSLNKLYLSQYLLLLKLTEDPLQINAIMDLTVSEFKEIIPELDVSFYEILKNKKFSISSLPSEFLLFAKNKKVIDFLLINGVKLDNQDFTVSQINKKIMFSQSLKMMTNFLYLLDLGLKLDSEIKENTDNIIYRMLSCQKTNDSQILELIKHLHSQEWNLTYLPNKKRVSREKAISLNWIKNNQELFDYLTDNNFFSVQDCFRKLKSKDSIHLMMYVLKKHKDIIIPAISINDMISRNVPKEIIFALMSEFKNSNRNEEMILSLVESETLLYKMNIHEKWRILKYIVEQKKDGFYGYNLLLMNGLTRNMYDYILKTTNSNIHHIDNEHENILFKLKSKEKITYFINKGVGSGLKNKVGETCLFRFFKKPDFINLFKDKNTFILNEDAQVNLFKHILNDNIPAERKKELLLFYSDKKVFSFIEGENNYLKFKVFDTIVDKEFLPFVEEFINLNNSMKRLTRMQSFLKQSSLHSNEEEINSFVNFINESNYEKELLENNRDIKEYVEESLSYNLYILIQKNSIALKPLLTCLLDIYGNDLLNYLKEREYLADNKKEWFFGVVENVRSLCESKKIKDQLKASDTDLSDNKKRRI